MNDAKKTLIQAINVELASFISKCQRARSWKERLELLAKLLLRIAKLIYFWWQKENRPKI